MAKLRSFLILFILAGTIRAQFWDKLTTPYPLTGVRNAAILYSNFTNVLITGGRDANNLQSRTAINYRLSTAGGANVPTLIGTPSLNTGSFVTEKSAIAQDSTNTLQLWAFGGVDANGAETNTLSTFNPTNLAWVPITNAVGTIPSARARAAAVYLTDCSITVANTPCIVVFGGEKGTIRYADTFVLWIGENPPRWERPTTYGSLPSARAGAYGSASNDGRIAYFFGGDTSTAPTADMFSFAPGGYLDAVAGSGESVNIAAGKLCNAPGQGGVADPYTITTNTGFYPNRATDGDLSNNFYHSWYNSTYPWGIDPSPWVSVDLSALSRWDFIQVYQRTDCCTGRNANFALRHGTSGLISNFNSMTSCSVPADIIGGSVKISCPATSSRYVFMRLLPNPGNPFRLLTVVELQVWQRNPMVWRQLSGVTNVAVGKPTAASSVYDNANSPPSKAVDGAFSVGTYPNMFHSQLTTTSANPVWFRVDLGAVYDIQSIRIYPRTDCCYLRNRRSSVLVSFTTDYSFGTGCPGIGNFDFTPGVFPGTVSSATSVSFPCPLQGRYVFLQRDPLNFPSGDPDSNVIQLVEFQVHANRLLNQPSARTGFAAAPYGGGFVIFGGADTSGYRMNDVRFFDFTTNTWWPSNLIKPIGTPPVARTNAMLIPLPDISSGAVTVNTASRQLLLFGGANSIGDVLSDVNILTLSGCPTLDRQGILSEVCTGAGTSCIYTCINGFTLANTAPLVCRADGVWIANGAAAILPPCMPPAPTPPTGITVSPFTDGSGSANVSWSATGITSYAPLTSFRVATVVPDVVENFGTGKFANTADWTWLASESMTTDSYSFINGFLTIDADAGANCWTNSAHNCAQLLRAFPSSVVDPTKPWAFEAQLTLGDRLTSGRVAAASQSLSIAIFNWGARRNFTNIGGSMEFHLGLQASSATAFNIGWEGIRGDMRAQWSRYFSAPSNTAFVRIERDPVARTWKGLYKFRASDAWATSIFVATDNMLFEGRDTIPVSNIALEITNRNWGSSRSYGAVKYVRIAPIDCGNPGSTRVVSPTTTLARIDGLTPGNRYVFTVEAGSYAGYSNVAASTSTLIPIPTAGAPNLGVIEVARGKPVSASSVYSATYAAAFANDGLFPTGNTNFFHSNCVTSNGEWWMVDLGVSTAVKSLRIYNRNDCCYSRINNFEVYVSDGQRWESAARCDPTLIPQTILTNDGAASLPYTARFPCNQNGLVGRYVIIHLPPGLNAVTDCYLMLSEVMVYASNSCPARTATNGVQVTGTNCAAGSGWGAVCTHQCLPGYVQVGGDTTATCNGDNWNSRPLVCAPICADLIAPSYTATCTQTLFSEDFSTSSTAIAKLVSLEPSYQALQSTGTGILKWYVQDGTLIAASRSGCNSELHLAIASPKIYNWQSDFQISVQVTTRDQAGIIWRAMNKDNMYRAYVDMPSQQIIIDIVLKTVPTIIARAPITLVSGVPFTMSLSSTNQRIDIVINNILVLSAGDRQLVVGNAGVYAATNAVFDNLVVSTPCKGMCTGMTDGDVCSFTCQTGLVPVGPATRTCVAPTSVSSGVFNPSVGQSFSCSLPAPTFIPTTISVAENSARNTNVGDPLVGYSSSPDYVLQWSILSQTPAEYDNLFYIDSCSGQVKVRIADINFERVRNYTLLVQASVPPFTSSFTQRNITVLIVNVDEPPVIVDTTLNVNENAPDGAVVGTPSWSDPENSIVTWTIIADSSGGKFTINPSTGLITVAPNATSGSYEGIASTRLVVKAVQTNINTLFGTGTVNINLVDVNDNPVITLGQELIIDERNATASAPVGTVVATDEDYGSFTSATSFALLSVADAGTYCGIGTTGDYPTTDGTSTGTMLFTVGSSTGTVSLIGNNIPLWYAMTAFPRNGILVRKVMKVCLNATDTFGGYSYGVVTIVVSAFAPAIPVITGISGATVMNTLGNEQVIFTGNAFGAAGQYTPLYAWYTNAAGVRYNASSCSVTVTDTEITCITAPGVGRDFTWFVFMRLDIIISTAQLSASYASPVVTGISGNTDLSTLGGTTAIFTGTNFGPPGTLIDIQYGNNFEFPCVQILNNTDSHTTIRCQVSPAAGRGLPWQITIAGQSFSSLVTTFDFLPPVITDIVNGTGSVSVNALDTYGGESIVIQGTNFGPAGTAFYFNIGPAALNFVNCLQDPGTAAHSVIRCVTPAGVGKDLSTMIYVAAQPANLPFRVTSTPGGYSYRVPVITRLSGPGTSNAATVGGQLVFIEGNNFGPITYPVPTIDFVRFGHRGDENRYSAVGCSVVQERPKTPLIQCATPEGVGRDHAWLLSIGGQNSSIYLANTSYAAPQVTGFSGPGAVDALTTGNQAVVISGRNFGPADNYTQNRLQVSYGVKLENGPFPSLTYLTSDCIILTPHVELKCSTLEGAGKALTWKVNIDAQNSVDPTTSYGAPYIDTVLSVATNQPLLDANVDGGDVIELKGKFMGPPNFQTTGKSLIQRISYGLSGTEYIVPAANWQHIDHETIRVTLLPGQGQLLSFVVAVADQVSPVSIATFSYALPSIVSIFPPVAHTYSNPRAPTIITLVTKNLPFRDPRSRLQLTFGNDPYAIILPLNVPSGSQSIAAATDPVAKTVNISFALPQDGGGKDLLVKVSVLSTGSNSEIVNTGNPSSSYFSYLEPHILDVVVTKALFAPIGNESTSDYLPCPFPVGIAFWDCTGTNPLVQLTIVGQDFSQAPSNRQDGMTRTLELLIRNDTINNEVYEIWRITNAIWIASWTHNKIIAYSPYASSTLRMTVTSPGPSTTDPIRIFTLLRKYENRNPFVGNLIGDNTDVPTTGVPFGDDALTIEVENLVGTTNIVVLVGGIPATMVSAPIAPYTNLSTPSARSQYITTELQSGPVVPIHILIPPGQGLKQLIQIYVYRNNLPNPEGSNTDKYVSYRAPVLTSIQYFKSTALTTPFRTLTPVSSITAVDNVPTDGSLVLRFIGTDLGIAPTIYVNDYELMGPTVVRDCSPTFPSTHTCYEITSPVGEGKGIGIGPSPSPYGFRLIFEAGNQDAVPVLFRYALPVVTSITSSTGEFPTQGGVTVTLQGYNFGTIIHNRGDSYIDVSFGRSDDRGVYLPCTDVVRPTDSSSHYFLNCTLPEGSGLNLTARVIVADQDPADTPHMLTYTAPEVTSIEVFSADNSTTLLGTANSTVPLLLQGSSTRGGDVFIITGKNFGAGDIDNLKVNCAFFTWRNRPTDPSLLHVCNDNEDWLGEGEVSSSLVQEWDHTRIVLSNPPGLGSKDIQLSIRGNTLKAPLKYKFTYPPPIVTSVVTTGSTATVERFSTEGGETLVITGQNFGPAPRNVTGDGRLQAIRFTQPVSLAEAPSVPMAYLSVVIERNTFRICNTLAADIFGARPPPVAGCDFNVISQTHEKIVFVSSPGVGLNRTLSVVVYDAPNYGDLSTQPYQKSNGYYFDYKPPVIFSFFPSIVLAMADESFVDIYGQDFGNAAKAVEQGWTTDETLFWGNVGGIACDPDVTKTNRRRELADAGILAILGGNGPREQTVVRCTFDASIVPAGYRNFTLRIAGQTAFASVDPPTSRSLLIVCASGFYGHVNETCLPCPAQNENPSLTGAICPGYNGKLTKFEDRFVYPRPLKGWYNLNSSDAYTVATGWTSGMMSMCPEGFQDNGRDVCIVPCDPPESCTGDNHCAYGYTSKAPQWRCSSCDKGFYKRAGECIKCPDSPGGLFIGFALLVAFVSSVGFLLNKKQVNIAVISIGVDFFQVLAIFSQSRIKWPPVVKELFHVLSAFNLNIEIVAPECLIPNVSYKQKFWFIMLLPLSVGFLLLMTFLVLAFNKAIIKGREKKKWWTHKPTLVSSTLILLYMLYLYLTRTIFDVFNCTPMMPPDGYTYLSVADNERCGVPGGTQVTLLPYAVAGLIVYTIGYPVFIGYTLWSNRELVMEDQLLRAKGVGNDLLSNPHAYHFRKQYGRSYFQFKPDNCMWILAIVIRKMFIALTAVVFNKNSSFQMAACLLVMFIAYSAQMMVYPYMSPSEYDEVLKNHIESSFTSAIHARLRTAIANIETRGRKKVRKNLINFEGKVDRSAILGVLSGWLFNYNTVEQIMLFAAVIVCLMGIMYQANELSSYYPESKDSVTAVVLAVIIIAIIYFFTVLITEVVVLYNEENRVKQLQKRNQRAGSIGKGSKDEKASTNARSSGKLVGDDGEINTGKLDTQMNPLFMNTGGNGTKVSGFGSDPDSTLEALLAQRESPPTEVWHLFQSSYGDLHSQIKELQQQLALARKTEAQNAVNNDDLDSGVSSNTSPMAVNKGKKTAFAPQSSGSTEQNPLSAVRGFGRANNQKSLRSMKGSV